MTATTVTVRSAAPDGPPKLTPGQLRQAQPQTLGAPRLRYSLLARALFKIMDIGYGYLVAPEWSYRLNADFEDHAEHEYMGYVASHPELETQADPGSYAAEYGRYDSVADLLRQIGHDERIHKLDSLVNMRTPRFRPAGC